MWLLCAWRWLKPSRVKSNSEEPVSQMKGLLSEQIIGCVSVLMHLWPNLQWLLQGPTPQLDTTRITVSAAFEQVTIHYSPQSAIDKKVISGDEKKKKTFSCLRLPQSWEHQVETLTLTGSYGENKLVNKPASENTLKVLHSINKIRFIFGQLGWKALLLQ